MDMKTQEPDIKPKLTLDWEDDDKADIEYVMGKVDKSVHNQFAQVFDVENKLLMKVRTQLPNGQWLMSSDGSYVEDWSQVSEKDMELFIQEAAAWLFFYNQDVIDAYAEAVFAKYTYDDAYDSEYSGQLTGTVGDKTARAKRRTQSERWLALYKTIYYKKAQGILDGLDQHVRRVERIFAERGKQAEREFRATHS
jgi:hypothetical protein